MCCSLIGCRWLLVVVVGCLNVLLFYSCRSVLFPVCVVCSCVGMVGCYLFWVVGCWLPVVGCCMLVVGCALVVG